MATGRQIVDALLLDIEKEGRPEELEKIAGEFINFLLDSSFSDHTKSNIVSTARRRIKDEMTESHPILDYLKFSEEFYYKFKLEKDERIQNRLKNKISLSYPDFIKIAQKLSDSPFLTLQVLGFILSTGRRVNECISTNFLVVGEKELYFTGQSKTRNEKAFVIPTLISASQILNNLQQAELKGFLVTENRDQLATRKVCRRIFNDTIHSLRSRYRTLILKREGVLDLDSDVDPLIRAKEILGHEWDTQDTLAYQGFSVSNKSTKESKEILNRIKSFELLQTGEEKKRRVLKGKTATDILRKILSDNPYLSKENLRETRTILRKAYKVRTGGQLNSYILNQFLFNEGWIEDLEPVLTDMEKYILKQFDSSDFSKDQKRGIIELWRLWRKKSTRGKVTLRLAKEKLGNDLTEEEFFDLANFFKSLE